MMTMNRRPSPEREARRRLLWLAPAIVVLVLAIRFWPQLTHLDRLELRTIDWRFTHRGPREPDPRLAIVEVDEGSVVELGRWPWPRRRFAQVIRTLQDIGVKAIIFDIFFAEPDLSEGGAASDQELIDATAEAGMVYHAAFGHTSTGSVRPAGDFGPAGRSWSQARVAHSGGLNAVARLFELGEVTAPLPGLAKAAADVGFVNVADSGDGVYRHTFPVVRRGDELYPSLSVAAAAGILDVPPARVTIYPGRAIDLGGRRRIPIDRSGRMLIDFAGGAGTYPYISVRDLLALADKQPDVARERLEGKIVFVAVSAPGLYDLRACPFDTVYNGVETQANALANILSGHMLRQAPGEVCIFTTIALAAALILGLSAPRPMWAMGVAIAVFVGYNWLAVALFADGIVIEMAAPNLVMLLMVLAALSVRLVGAESEQERTLGALSRFVPAAVMERVIEEDADALLQGQRRVVTVMFADIRNFTDRSEQMAPEQTVELLNRFFYLVHETIWEFEGTLDKYIGDGLMAFWNSPAEQPDHALLAVRAAVHMQRRIRYNQAEWEFHGMPELAAGIGVASGEAVVGYVGTGERMQYTAIGARVNLASRLENLTKEFGAQILVSRETYEQVAGAVEARAIGPVEVRGFSEPVEVWEILDLKYE